MCQVLDTRDRKKKKLNTKQPFCTPPTEKLDSNGHNSHAIQMHSSEDHLTQVQHITHNSFIVGQRLTRDAIPPRCEIYRNIKAALHERRQRRHKKRNESSQLISSIAFTQLLLRPRQYFLSFKNNYYALRCVFSFIL